MKSKININNSAKNSKINVDEVMGNLLMKSNKNTEIAIGAGAVSDYNYPSVCLALHLPL